MMFKIKLYLEYQDAETAYKSFINKGQLVAVSEELIKLENLLKIVPLVEEKEILELKEKLMNISKDSNGIKQNFMIKIRSLQNELGILNNKKSSGLTLISKITYMQEESLRISGQTLTLEKSLDMMLDRILLEKTAELSKVKVDVDNAKYYAEMFVYHQKLVKMSEDINTKHRDLSELHSFKQVAFDLECNQLQLTVDSINEAVNNILEDIFDKPIKVYLKLYNKNKTNDKIKSNVNLQIQYDGNEYDGINHLSGGEKDRISFALTLALSRVNGSPFLLLDEVMRSLNDSYRTLCVDAMRKFLDGNKTVLCINHEDVEGNYDNVVSLE